MLALLKVILLSLPQSRRYRVVFYKIHIKCYILSLAHTLPFLGSRTASPAFHRSSPQPDLPRDGFSAVWLAKIVIYKIRTSISVQLQLESALSVGMQMSSAKSWAACCWYRTDSKSNHGSAVWFLLWMLSTITRKSKGNRNKAHFYMVCTVSQSKAGSCMQWETCSCMPENPFNPWFMLLHLSHHVFVLSSLISKPRYISLQRYFL